MLYEFFFLFVIFPTTPNTDYRCLPFIRIFITFDINHLFLFFFDLVFPFSPNEICFVENIEPLRQCAQLSVLHA